MDGLDQDLLSNKVNNSSKVNNSNNNRGNNCNKDNKTIIFTSDLKNKFNDLMGLILFESKGKII